MKPKQITSFFLNGFLYKHKDYGNDQHRYTKTEMRKVCPMTITKFEFDRAKREKEEFNNLSRSF